MNINKIVTALLGAFLAKKGIKSIAKKRALNDPKIRNRIKQLQADLDALNNELDKMD